MILDERLEFADAEDISAAAGTQLVGDVIDMESARDFGHGQPLYLVIQVTAAFLSAGAATVQFKLASDAGAAIATNGTASEHSLTGVIGKATLVAGFTMVLPVPAEGVPYERYLGVLATTGTATTTQGSVNAFLTMEPTRWNPEPDSGIN